MQIWVSIASDATCAAALQQAVVDFGVVDTDTLQAVLQIPETAAGLARALCTALQAAPPAAESMTDEHTVKPMESPVESLDAGVSAVGAIVRACPKLDVLELGSNDAYMVLEDADIDKAVGICATARLYNNGQTCIAPDHVYVHEDVKDEFVL